MNWIDEAKAELQSRQRPDGCWSYRPSGGSATEPTALAAMALAAHGVDAGAALDALASLQHNDGGLGAFGLLDEGNWCTAVAATAFLAAGRTVPGEAAIDWLLSVPVHSFRQSAAFAPYGYNTALTAWPWTYGDYSWVEPTAWTILALRRSGRSAGGHIEKGQALLLDRQIPQGGWNYGEPKVLGADLSPAAAPTALALLALPHLEDAVSGAVGFLEGQLGAQTSLFSLAWSAIALSARGRLTAFWWTAMEQQWTAAAHWRESDGGMLAALTLLATAPPTDNPLMTVGHHA